MLETPTKVLNSSQSLTPVRFLDSPRIKSPSSNSNFATCRARLDVIIKTLQENYGKWQLAQKRGLSLCHSIEAIKTRCLESATNKAIDEVCLYPNELRPYSDKLAVITSVFNDITSNARESHRQLNALVKLPGVDAEIFYRSWRIDNFLHFIKTILNCYEEELLVKQHVMREIAHLTTRSDLIRASTAWEYPQHVDELGMMFAFLAEEIKIRN